MSTVAPEHSVPLSPPARSWAVPPRLTRYLRGLAVAAGLCLVTLLVVEVALRLFWSEAQYGWSNAYYLWPPHYQEVLTPRQDVAPGTSPVVHFVVNSQGIRGPEWSANRGSEYRILAVGGSTTEQHYLDQDRTWTALLGTGLGQTSDGKQIWVGNVGRSGFETRDHLGFMQLALGQYDVDSLVFLVGANDLLMRLDEGAKYDPNFTDEQAQYQAWLLTRFAIVPWTKAAPLHQLALWHLGQRVKLGLELLQNPRVQDRDGSFLIGLRQDYQKSTLKTALPDLTPGLDEYQRNITRIAQDARQRGIRAVFMTQPVLWKPGMTEQERSLLWMSDYDPALLAQAMDAYNARLMATCREQGLECLDVASQVPRTTTYFYDDMHLTEAGAATVAVQLTAYFRTSTPFAATGS